MAWQARGVVQAAQITAWIVCTLVSQVHGFSVEEAQPSSWSANSTYATFTNVRWTGDELIFYASAGTASQLPPAELNEQNLLVGQFWQDPLKVTVLGAHEQSACTSWTTTPTLIWDTVFWGNGLNNAYHAFLDNLTPLVHTLLEKGLLSMDDFERRQGAPSSDEANLILIALEPEVETFRFAHLLQQLTPDVWIAPQGANKCYRELHIGLDSSLRTYTVLEGDESLQRQKVNAMARFQRWALLAQQRSEASTNATAVLQHPPSPAHQRRLHIGLVSRPRTPYNSRAMTNEAEVVSALQTHLGPRADVRLLTFNGSLTQAMQDARRTDVLIGMHGAGMTNMLWQRPGGAVVQLFPYGWELPHGGHHVQALFQQLAANMNLTHAKWANTLANNSFFVEQDFIVEKHAYRLHPDPQEETPGALWNTPEGPPRYWHYQDTLIDVDSLLPVVDYAVSSVRRARKQASH